MLTRLCILATVAAAFSVPPVVQAANGRPPKLVFCCDAGNDLFGVVKEMGIAVTRTDDPAQAIANRQALAGVHREHALADTLERFGQADHSLFEGIDTTGLAGDFAGHQTGVMASGP